MPDMHKLGRILGISIAVMVPLFAACSSTASSDADGGTPTGSTGFKNCSSSSSSSSACKNGELETYAKCAVDKCKPTYKKCYGNDFESGSFAGGVCEKYIACTQACPCNDTACTQKCGAPDSACATCNQELGSCVTSNCTIPTCATGGTNPSADAGAAGTCADLSACCAAISDANQKKSCESLAGSGVDSSCGQALKGFKAANLCP